MRRRRKPPSKAKQIRQLKEQLEHELAQMDKIARTAEEWKNNSATIEQINHELHEENESIKQDFKTCKAWSSLECCIQHESSLRVFRASIDISERYLTYAHRMVSPNILKNPLLTDRSKHDARWEIYEAALQISNIVRRKVADSMLDYFSDTDRQLNDGRIY